MRDESNAVCERPSDGLPRDVVPVLLQYGDAASMAHGIESRPPHVDHRFVAFCIRLQDEYKLGAGNTKCILKRSVPWVLPNRRGLCRG
jgi:asparagine synthetase B (glutamine-hydrolysing)